MIAADVLMRVDAWGFALARFLLALSWQFALLTAAAMCATHVLRKTGARIRHRIWTAVFLLAPVMPAVVFVVGRTGAPRMEVRVMPAYVTPLRPATPPPVTWLSAASATELAPEKHSFCPWAAGLLIYGMGAIGLLGLVALGRYRLGTFSREGRIVRNARVLDIFDDVRRRLAIRREIFLVEAGAVDAPLTIGTLEPVVMMPPGFAASLSDSEIRAFATHELTHVKRFDSLLLCYVSIIRAILYFHPVVWFATRRLCLMAEHACDDVVIETEQAPLDYAQMLVRLARGMSGGRMSAEPAAGFMVTKNQFFERVEEIIADRRDRITRLSRRMFAGCVAGGCAVVCLIAAVPIAEMDAGTMGFHRAGTAESLDGTMVFRARIIDSETGRPLQGVRIYSEQTVVSSAVSDRNGYVEIPGMKPGVTLFHVMFDTGSIADWWLTDDVDTGGDLVRELAGSASDGPRFAPIELDISAKMKPVTILIEPGMTVTGSVFTMDRSPVDGAAVMYGNGDVDGASTGQPWFSTALTIHDTTQPARLLAAPKMVITGTVYGPDGVPVAGATVIPGRTGTGRTVYDDTRLNVRTDENGRYTVYLPASGDVEYNLLAHDGGYGEFRTWANGVRAPIKTTFGGRLDNYDIIMRRPVTIRGIVVDETGAPLAGEPVMAVGADGLSISEYAPSAITGPDGRFEITHARPGEVWVVTAPRNTGTRQSSLLPPECMRLLTVTGDQTIDDVKLVSERPGRLQANGAISRNIPGTTRRDG